MFFQDRIDGGKKLAEQLSSYKDLKDTIVIGLARGGVITAAALATELHLPFNVLIVRKIGAPNNPELAIGAITETGEGVYNEDLIRMLEVSSEYIKKTVEKEKKIAEMRLKLYRQSVLPPKIKEKTVILVDDGIATGASMEVAIKAVRIAGAKKVILAIPVAAPDSLDRLKRLVDDAVCLYSPASFQSVGVFYQDFSQTTDDEVVNLFRK